MKTLKTTLILFAISSLAACSQQLVEFVDLSVGTDMSGAGGADLAGRDFSATQQDLAFDLANSDGSESLPPMVIAVTPLNLAMNVATFRTATATFNKAMDPLSINALTFTVREQSALQPLAGVVSYGVGNLTAVFKPASPLLINTTYVATITTGAKDTFGTSLVANYVWTFTTAAQACGMAPVILGAAGNFGVLAGSTITNSGPTVINGDIGVNPGTAITGFGPSPGVGGPGIVNGTQRKPPDVAVVQATLDLTTASIDAAGRSLCFVTIANGELGGRTLTPGLYRSGISSFAITSSDLTLDAQGDSEAVFIFQTSTSTLDVHNGRAVILSGGAKASNVFWSVGTSATIGTTAIFKGTILADQMISIDTGAVVDGRALAHIGSVTLLSNTITVPAP